MKNSYKILTLILTLGLTYTAQADPDAAYYGQRPVAVDSKLKAPKESSADAFGSELFIDGNVDVALDARSMAADSLIEKERAKERFWNTLFFFVSSMEIRVYFTNNNVFK
jgi:hypothetical protein